MDIIDISESTQEDYLTCMEEWSDEMKDGVCRKECWYDAMREKGLRVKLARNPAGVVAGMIHYAPIEYSWVEGEDLYFVYCIWVHGHKKGRGDLRKQGVGKALLRAAEDDAKALNTKGLVVWGLLLPFFMRAGWFKKQGYQKADMRHQCAVVEKIHGRCNSSQMDKGEKETGSGSRQGGGDRPGERVVLRDQRYDRARKTDQHRIRGQGHLSRDRYGLTSGCARMGFVGRIIRG